MAVERQQLSIAGADAGVHGGRSAQMLDSQQLATRPGRDYDASIERVVVIERCNGAQVGEENVQYSTFRLSFAQCELRLDRALIEKLINANDSWRGDAFHDNGRLPASRPATNGSSTSSREVLPTSRGETLVIVKQSRGVQVGYGNTQHNEFRFRIADCGIHVDRLSSNSIRRVAATQLRKDPHDQQAARALAEDIIRAATEYLDARLNLELAARIGRPQIDWSRLVSDRDAVQVGLRNESHQSTEIATPTLPATRVARDIHECLSATYEPTDSRDRAVELDRPVSRDIDALE